MEKSDSFNYLKNRVLNFSHVVILKTVAIVFSACSFLTVEGERVRKTSSNVLEFFSV